MIKNVMSVVVIIVIVNMLHISVVTYTVFDTTVNTAGLPYTLHLAHKTIAASSKRMETAPEQLISSLNSLHYQGPIPTDQCFSKHLVKLD